MTKRATVTDFPIGCMVKVVGPIPKEKQWYLDEYVDEIGMVISHDHGMVVVSFGPCSEPNGILADIAWLERGRVEWISE